MILAKAAVCLLMTLVTLASVADCTAEEKADWGPAPGEPWRGVHTFARHPAEAETLIAELPKLEAVGVNVLVVEVDYGFAYTSHPELRGKDPLTLDDAQRLSAACRKHGIRLIPQFQCLGHQSWKTNTNRLLTEHPEFDETPGRFPDNKGIYCRSWCPLHPGVNPIIFDLFDELIDAFDADAMHVGMDEVFLIGSEHCPRCRGKDPAELFARAVGDYHRHLVKERGVEMLMWGDRLLSSEATSYSRWEASANGTHGAIDHVPTDIVICDWHYGKRDAYPSVDVFQQKGFRVWPSGWNKAEATEAFLDYAQAHDTGRVLGHLCTTWKPAWDGMSAWPPIRAAMKRLDEAPGEPPATHFSFTKAGTLIERPADMPAPGPYYPCLVDMSDVEGFPFDYALYVSTDHDAGAGGIWLYLCDGTPTVADNWTSYDKAAAAGMFDYLETRPKRNPIFVDAAQGRQTETPYANVIDGAVYMTYHNARAGHSQSTLLATSADGVNFARIHGDDDSVIIDYDPRTAPGNGHTGYFRWAPNPFAGVDAKYVGYSLHGGGNQSHSAMWTSDDAVHWQRVEVFDHVEGQAIDEEMFVKWPEIDPRSITPLGNGEYVAIGVGGTRSHGNRPRVNDLFEIFLAADGRTLTRRCRRILPHGAEGSPDAGEVSQPTTIRTGDTWRLIYVGTSRDASRNTVMGATGTFTRNASPSEPLKPEDRTRHWMTGD